mgnify:CR=1 FL=1
MFQKKINVSTDGRDTYSITSIVQNMVRESGIKTGICYIFLKHTSASLILCEKADPSVREDLENFMSRFVLDGDPIYSHRDEGPDDMSAHIRSILTHNDLSLPVTDGLCDLGVWQGIFLWEHRISPHDRTIVITVMGTD